jgi:2-oxo-4-hydroxy-4-carboxy-5-ureidoimidazoline decarboxylase
MSMSRLDEVSEEEFVSLLSGVYEHSAWVAERVVRGRPYRTIENLARALHEAVARAGQDEQLDLICAHPELVGRLADSDAVTLESRSEQAQAGLDRSSEAQIEEMRELNRRYRERFGFPFIVAVRGLARDDIVALLKARTERTVSEEFGQCLLEIGKIARLRLADRISEP